MTIIKIDALESGYHPIEMQCPCDHCWLEGYIAVPPELEQKAWESKGYCDLVIEDGILIDIKIKEIPVDIDNIKNNKNTELSNICQQTIYNGTTIELSDGSTQLFTYDLHDQGNIFEMYDAVNKGATQYIYQSQDGSCMIYSKNDIITIYGTLSALKTKTITYYHQLKDYVNSLSSTDEINAVTWGQELTGEYLEKYNEFMAIAEESMNVVLTSVMNS